MSAAHYYGTVREGGQFFGVCTCGKKTVGRGFLGDAEAAIRQHFEAKHTHAAVPSVPANRTEK